MSQPPTAAASSRFPAIFDAALKSYQKQTKKDLLKHPLASQLKSCDSTSAILAVLQDQVQQFDKSRSGDDRLTRWMAPTVNVLWAFSAVVSGGVGLVSLHTGVNVSLQASPNICFRYFRLQILSSQASVSSFQQVSYLFLWEDRSHVQSPIDSQGCCGE